MKLQRRHRGNRAAFLLACAGLGLVATGAATAQTAADDTQALLAALDEEYRSEASYQAVVDAFGPQLPFARIVNAEGHHSGMVKQHLSAIGEPIPDNPYLGQIEAPASVLAACEAAVQNEIDNVAFYDRVLPTITDPGVRQTLVRLQTASRERHLPAFQRCVANGGTMGEGMMGGHGQGGGMMGGHGQGGGMMGGHGQGEGMMGGHGEGGGMMGGHGQGGGMMGGHGQGGGMMGGHGQGEGMMGEPSSQGDGETGQASGEADQASGSH